MKDYKFRVEGGFTVDVPKEIVNDNPHCGITEFELPDGRFVRLIVALEIHDPKTDTMEYVTAERRMSTLGFTELEYVCAEFEEL